MIKRIREEKGGFTLAELLIVVAIILVLVAVAVPVFTGAMDNANKSVFEANVRAARMEAANDYLSNHASDTGALYHVSLFRQSTSVGMRACSSSRRGRVVQSRCQT